MVELGLCLVVCRCIVVVSFQVLFSVLARIVLSVCGVATLLLGYRGLVVVLCYILHTLLCLLLGLIRLVLLPFLSPLKHFF